MQPNEQYLFEYLEEEFSRYPGMRVQTRKEDGEWGVVVRSESRQWFFPFEWSSGQGFKKVHAQVNQIIEIIE
jgi:hypothetical protein